MFHLKIFYAHFIFLLQTEKTDQIIVKDSFSSDIMQKLQPDMHSRT